jgi:YD repeat-containing protein
MKLKYLFLFSILLASAKIYAQSSVVQTTGLKYNNDGFVKEEKSVMSNGDTLIKRYNYVNDINPMPACSGSAASVEAQGYLYLKNKNIINMPVEKYSIVKNPSNNVEKIIAGELTIFWENKPYAKATYALETTVPLTSFTPCSFSNGVCGLSYSSSYKLQATYDVYDNYGNLLESTVKGKKISGIFGYKGAYKIAEVSNASNAEIAYTSFENMDDKGFWTYNTSGIVNTGLLVTPTGSNAFNMTSGSINRSQLNSKKYIVSYWHKNGSITVSGSSSTKTGATINGWIYEEQLVNSATNVTVSGTGYIDELRLYPADAQMSTYVYQPLVGVIAENDVKNMISYYEYDQLGRVVLKRDQKGNILKKMEYGIQKTE